MTSGGGEVATSATTTDGGSTAAARLRSADDPSNVDPTLLTLPRTDLIPRRAAASSDDSDDEDTEQLVLLQLPPATRGGDRSLNVKDLLSGTARIVGAAPPSEFTEGSDDDDGEEERKRKRQACLVVERTGASFALSRVETSNALVLVPPQRVAVAPPNAPAEEGGGARPSPAAKRKRGAGGYATMKARLLLTDVAAGGGGRGGSRVASFLELKPRTLDRAALRRKLSRHVYDPYSSSSERRIRGRRGLTAEALASDLQCAESSVAKALREVGAFPMPGDGGADDVPVRYGVLSEEATHEAKTAIVSALTECDELTEYDTVGVNVDVCVRETKVRLKESEGNDAVGDFEDGVVKHCLRDFCKEEGDGGEGKEVEGGLIVKLDVNKIATFLAHRLFISRTEPWTAPEFLAKWQSLVPGVGDAYRPNLDLLRGIALHDDEVPNPRGRGGNVDDSGVGGKGGFLTYFPEEKLPIEPGARFRSLFKQRERWTLEELEPYVGRLADEGGGASKAELLLRHARVVEDDGEGKGSGTKRYVAR